MEISTFPQRCLETRGIFLKMLTFVCFNYLHSGKKYRNNKEETVRNLSYGFVQNSLTLYVEYYKLRIWEPDIQNSDKETKKKVFKKYRNVSTRAFFFKGKSKQKQMFSVT